jgi:thiosulfate reductase cytochrome b subunit
MSSGGSRLANHTGWRRLLWIIPALLAALVVVVLLARWVCGLEPVANFIDQYPGTAPPPADAPVGIPAWLSWQHGFNALLILLIIRSGWRVRTVTRPPAMWTRNNTGPLRTKRPPRKISLDLWFHLSLDALWVLNGIVFYVLLFATGQWMRIVPTDLAVVPNALSAALQYASFNWPTENGWVSYNALQQLAYFVTVFIAAPVAILSGLRMSAAWPAQARINRFYPRPLARAVHLPTMLYFVVFIVVHVTLVLATGAVRNLNHMYAGRDDDSWIGVAVFAVSLAIMAIAWVAARPLLLRPLAALTGKVSSR